MSKTCQNCGNVFEDNVNICPRCGMQSIGMQQSVPYPQPQQPYQQYYQQPYQQQYPNYENPAEQPMTLGSWVGTILLTHLFGIISIILLFVWGFSSGVPTAKKNYCRAMLIYYAVIIAFSILICIIVLAVFAANGEAFLDALEKYSSYY